MFRNFITKICRKLMSGGSCHEVRTPDGCHVISRPIPPHR